ncbi:hypothetical protein [Paenibacillus ginsengarvi]|uniref:Uncharacterized protein n=1 Tax=Paenibacillus ginsengarvi TaxID=400777 RepID=A0A3B0CT22_9BACL|nr:hypothetical protein [Paenibacillus ginsengarvi]RKN85946.1 hypothetical protein D7M11_06350 [Paenibacillus ginsengarvi]
MEYLRDYAMYAAVFGLFSMSWFGWAQEKPRESWRLYLGIASGLALLVCLTGVYLSITNWSAPSALNDDRAFRAYLIAFYTEIVLAGGGSYLLYRAKKKDFTAPWITFIVGLHFISLKSVFEDSGLYVLAALMVAVAAVSVYVARRLGVAPSAITGIGSGASLFVFALLGLLRFFTAS